MSPNKATYSLLFCGAPSSGTGSFKRTGGKGRRRRAEERRRGSLRWSGAAGGAARPPPGGHRGRDRSPLVAAAERRRVQHRGADSSRRPPCGERPARAPGPAAGSASPPAEGENRGGVGMERGSTAPTDRERELQLAIDSEIYRQGDSPFCKNSPCLSSGHAPNSLCRRVYPSRFREKVERKGKNNSGMHKIKTRLTATFCIMHRKDHYLPKRELLG